MKTTDALPANSNIAPAKKEDAGDMMDAALRETMNGKPVLDHECKSVLSESLAFAHKKLSTGPVLNFGEACCYRCTYCYVPSATGRFGRIQETLCGRAHQDVVVRRKNGLELLEADLKERE